jgi:hypothetical protein
MHEKIRTGAREKEAPCFEKVHSGEEIKGGRSENRRPGKAYQWLKVKRLPIPFPIP